jgi:hypothetical protein
VNLTNIHGIGQSVNTVALNVAISPHYVQDSVFNWAVLVGDNNLPSNQGSEYFVTVNFTNNSTMFAGPVEFGLLAQSPPPLPPVQVNFDTFGPGNFDPTPAAAGFTTISHAPTRIVFKGGGVAQGGSTAFNFSIDLADIVPVGGPGGTTTGTFLLTMRVNPEPTSLLLGASALCMGGLALRRRSRKQVANSGDGQATQV